MLVVRICGLFDIILSKDEHQQNRIILHHGRSIHQLISQCVCHYNNINCTSCPALSVYVLVLHQNLTDFVFNIVNQWTDGYHTKKEIGSPRRMDTEECADRYFTSNDRVWQAKHLTCDRFLHWPHHAGRHFDHVSTTIFCCVHAHSWRQTDQAWNKTDLHSFTVDTAVSDQYFKWYMWWERWYCSVDDI